MELAGELRAALQELLTSAAIEIREDGGRVTPAGPLSWEVRGALGKPLLHLWAENCNLTRRVVAIAEQEESRMVLAVERFGRARPERLEIVRLQFQRGVKAILREDFCARLRRILAQQFPDEVVEKLSIAADLEHTLSRVYARGIARKGLRRCAFLAVPEGESGEAMESSLTYALLWLERARRMSGGGNISFLRMILPAGKASVLPQKLRVLDSRLAIQVCELNSLDERIERVDPLENGNVNSWLVPHKELAMLKGRAQADLEPIMAMAPEAIQVHAVPQEQEVVLRFRGLAFVKWRDRQIYFSKDSAWELLRSHNEAQLKQLVKKLQNFRNPLAKNTRHVLYRAQAERWLQSIVTQDVSRIDFALEPAPVYEQVFAHSGSLHGILDLLAMTRSKRLAILELKTADNPDLPLQAADYWMRIKEHHARGELARYGYFPGVELQATPPVVYLVAPALRFHPSTDAILRYLTPEMEIVRVGLAESWRRGLRVMLRQ